MLITEEQFEDAIAHAQSLEDLSCVLERLFSGGFNVWTDGRLCLNKDLVARVDGLSIVINPKERGHNVPHFHVRGYGLEASYSIETCQRLQGNLDSRKERLVRWFHQRSVNKLREAWISTRPTG